MNLALTLWQRVTARSGQVSPPGTVLERLCKGERRLGDFGEIDHFTQTLLFPILPLFQVFVKGGPTVSIVSLLDKDLLADLQIRVLRPLQCLVQAIKHFHSSTFPIRPQIHTLQCRANKSIRGRAAQDQQDVFRAEKPLYPDKGLGGGKVEPVDESKVEDQEPDGVVLPFRQVEQFSNLLFDQGYGTEEH